MITASKLSISSFPSISFPTSVLVTNSIPSCASISTRRSTIFLSRWGLGIPYMSSPPMRSSLSNTVTRCPALLSCAAHASPAGPEPMTATFFPVLCSGGSGVIHPSSKPLSTMAHSILFMVTAGSFMPRTHDPSQGAGHIRPVNSGKLLVL